MKYRRYPLGSVEVTDKAVIITEFIGHKTIPLSRITSVDLGGFSGKLRIETGAKTHKVAFWNQLGARRIREAIEEAITH